MSVIKTDVVVVGGGIVGAAIACGLSLGGIQTVLVEGRMPQREWGEGMADLRVSALTQASKNILENLSCWKGVEKRAATAYREMKIWDCAANGELHFDGADVGGDILGHIVENRVTVASLWDALEQNESASIICPARVTALDNGKERARLTLDDGRVIEAELVVAADGRESMVRTMAGISVNGWEYDHSGLVATVRPEKGHNDTCYQRFLADGGILAFLPISDGTCSIVWSIERGHAKELLALDEAAFLKALTTASDGLLGEIKEVGDRAAFPLKLQYASHYSKGRVVLAGDAAHALHPLAGQGANQGLLDSASLIELLLEAHKEGRPLASQQPLRRYERWRKSDNYTMMGAMDGLKKVYGASFTPFEQLRSMGMNFINQTVPVKNQFTRYAMGKHHDMPRLSKGELAGL
jgi:2-octaprenylphenol hydroxylase